MAVMFDIIYLKRPAYMKCHFPPCALRVHNDAEVGSQAQGRTCMYAPRKKAFYTQVYTPLVQCTRLAAHFPSLLPSLILKVRRPSQSPKDAWQGQKEGAATRTQRPNRVVTCLVVNNLKHCF